MTTQTHTNSQLQADELRLDAVVLRDLDVDRDTAKDLLAGSASRTVPGGTNTC